MREKGLLDQEKVKLVSYAANKKGHKRIQYPLQHALVFYLMNKGFHFNYNFALRSDPGLATLTKIPDYPWSKRLDSHISELVSYGYLKLERGSFYLVWNEERNKEMAAYVDALKQEKEDFEEMEEVVDKSLSNKSLLIRTCYKLYLKLL